MNSTIKVMVRIRTNRLTGTKEVHRVGARCEVTLLLSNTIRGVPD